MYYIYIYMYVFTPAPALNTVCDIYFTGALTVMVNEWKIKPDVPPLRRG